MEQPGVAGRNYGVGAGARRPDRGGPVAQSIADADLPFQRENTRIGRQLAVRGSLATATTRGGGKARTGACGRVSGLTRARPRARRATGLYRLRARPAPR